ncbi:AraC family transcriptional regulator [Methylobacterium sp. P31]
MTSSPPASQSAWPRNPQGPSRDADRSARQSLHCSQSRRARPRAVAGRCRGGRVAAPPAGAVPRGRAQHRRLDLAAQARKGRATAIRSGLLARSGGEVAYRCGFIDQAHFSRRFRGRYGISPRDYRHMTLSQAAQG